MFERNNYKHGLYFANWTIYGKKYDPNDIDTNKVSHIFYSFINLDPATGDLKLSDEWADLQIPVTVKSTNKKVEGHFKFFHELKLKNRNLQVLMSVGGWSYRFNFAKAVDTDTKISNLVNSAVNFVQEYGFDGVDLDWEYPENKSEAERYLKLVQQLKAGLNELEAKSGYKKDSLLISCAIPSVQGPLQNFELNKMDKYVDFWNLMSYDFSGSWSDKVKYQSNLFPYPGSDWSIQQALSYLKDVHKISFSKVVMGIPLYGRVFCNTQGLSQGFNGVGGNEGIIDYVKILEAYGKSAMKFDAVAGSAYVYDAKNKTFYAFDNEDSVKLKSAYVKHNGLAGCMWWESSGESKDVSLLDVYFNEIGHKNLDKSLNHVDYPFSKYLNN